MAYAFVWLCIGGLIGLWSLAAWAFHELGQWAIATSGGWSGAPLRLPGWIEPWIAPEWEAVISASIGAMAPAIESMVAWAPALLGGFTAAVWVAWALVTAGLVVMGLLLSLLVAGLRRARWRRTYRAGLVDMHG